MSPEKEIKISHLQPPSSIYDRAVERWGVDFSTGTLFTVDNVIYSKGIIPADLLIHEQNHVKQQREYPGGYKKWWDRYFEDDEFRLDQEVECYRIQYQFIKKNTKDRNQQSKHLSHFARSLSGKMYGNLISLLEAIKLLQ